MDDALYEAAIRQIYVELRNLKDQARHISDVKLRTNLDDKLVVADYLHAQLNELVWKVRRSIRHVEQTRQEQ